MIMPFVSESRRFILGLLMLGGVFVSGARPSGLVRSGRLSPYQYVP